MFPEGFKALRIIIQQGGELTSSQRKVYLLLVDDGKYLMSCILTLLCDRQKIPFLLFFLLLSFVRQKKKIEERKKYFLGIYIFATFSSFKPAYITLNQILFFLPIYAHTNTHTIFSRKSISYLYILLTLCVCMVFSKRTASAQY